MNKLYSKIVLLSIIIFCAIVASNSYASNNKLGINKKLVNRFSTKNINSKSPIHNNGIVFPININPLVVPNLKVNQTADYKFSYLVSNTKNIPAISYLWVDFDNNGIYSADEAALATIPANAVNFKVNVSFANATFINKLKIGTLNIKFTTTTTTLTDDELTPTLDERSTSMGVDGETETFSEKSIAGITISGSVFTDGNGITDAIIFGTGVGIIEGIPLNAYLLDNTNTVISKAVFSLGGSYKFENLYKGTYIVAISRNNYSNGTLLTSLVPNLPTGWNLAGESYGSIGNLPLGIEPGLPNMQIPIVTQTAAGGTDIFGVNFGLNRTPTATNDEVSTPINTPVADCNLVANDNDPDGNQTIDKTTIILIDPADGLKKTTVTLIGKGEFKVNAAGEVSFTPVHNFLGVAPVISYTVKDKGGIESNTGIIKLVVKPVGVDDAKILDEEVPSVTINVLANDGISGILAVPAETFENPADATIVANPNGDITFIFPPNQKVPNTYVYTYVLKTADGVYSDPITATITVAYSPAITLIKTAEFNDTNNDGLAQAGETITYGFKVTNTGNVPIVNITVSDPKISLLNAAVLPNPLKPGETGFLTILPNIYTITPADIQAGQVVNTATAQGFEPVTKKTVNSTSEVIVIFPVLKLKLVKSSKIIDVNNNGFTDVGDKIEYTFTVTNTGTVPIINVGITDPKIGILNAAISPSTLAPGQVGVLVSANTYIITLNDIIKGYVSNKATADGTNAQNTPVSATSQNGNLTSITDPTCPTCTITEIIKKPQISLLKTAVFNDANADTYAQVGETITYTFTIKNTGNVTINSITLNDAMLAMVNVTINPASLLPGQMGTYTVNYPLSQANIDEGSVSNTAIAIGFDPSNVEVSDTSGTSNDNNNPTVITIEKSPSISLIKTSQIIDVNNNGITDEGDKIEYTFTVKNTGKLPVNNISITDPKIAILNVAIIPSSLSPNETGVLTSANTYTITSTDITKGYVSNKAIANGKSPQNTTVTAQSQNGNNTSVKDPDCPTCTVTEIIKKPQISLLKTAVFNDANGDTFAQEGETITYTFTIKNTGNATINNITLSDIKLGLVNVPFTFATLIPGQMGTYTVNYPLTQANIDAGSISNTAIAIGFDQANVKVSDTSGTSNDNDAPTVTVIDKKPSISLIKSSTITDINNNGITDIGDKINYIFTVKNTGNVTLSNITVTDVKAPIIGGPIAKLNPLEVNNTAFTASHIITQADVDKGFVYNIATVLASSPGETNNVVDTSKNGNPTKPTDIIDPVCPECTITPVTQVGKITLVKRVINTGTGPNGVFLLGEVIRYSFTITNVGNVTLKSIILTDPRFLTPNIELPSSILLPKESLIVNGEYTVTAADIAAGIIKNQAIVKGIDPRNAVVEDKSGTENETDDNTVTSLIDGFFIPNVFTPNNDGINDTFEIKGIENYKGVEIEVFNRWGNQVYKNMNYQNQWLADGLNEGTYYYLVRLKTATEPKIVKGWVLIKH
ncbi:MAG: hypothetical protein EAZ51_09520 [Sphingobacteriales bacterium]|nr:MAG: hypothetical protein EAZ64_05940 [Sphingobacteriales bacterium]TAF78433.1 MAG: hypothetical protein EAZ51_09520 [Sphingobacteriales bacterium]